jgi:hypothetical protein
VAERELAPSVAGGGGGVGQLGLNERQTVVAKWKEMGQYCPLPQPSASGVLGLVKEVTGAGPGA